MRKTIIMVLVAFFMSVGTAMAAVNINTATKAQLVELPGIGAVKADAIITYRKAHGDFASVNELAQVKGIGESTVANLKNEISVGGTK